MKKKFIVLLALIYSFAFSACGMTKKSVTQDNEKVIPDEKEWLAEISREVTDGLLKLTYDETYLKAFLSSDDEISSLVKELQGAEVDTDNIYIQNISQEESVSFLKKNGNCDFESLSDTGKEILYNRMTDTMPNYLMSRQGTQYLVTYSLLQYPLSYVSEYEIENQIWFMPTDKDGLWVCVSFRNSGENVITANACYVYSGEDDLKETLSMFLY